MPSHLCFALRADELNGQCLQLSKSDCGRSRITTFTASAGANPSGNARARFSLEPSQEHKDMVHVRCCFSNKYWAVREEATPSNGYLYYIGDADEPDEDLSSMRCTLFGFMYTITFGNIDIKFRAADNRFSKWDAESWVSIKPRSGITTNYLHLRSMREESFFRVIGLSPRNELPKYVAFKGDNGKYLRYSNTWLRFDSEDISDEGVICEVYTNPDGAVQIKSHMGGYWRLRRDYGPLAWIAADAPYSKDGDPDMAFKVITGAEGEDKALTIALQNMGNRSFCNRLNDKKDGVSYLSASEGSISQWARFTVEEPVIRREISDVEFHLDEARIYNNALVVLDEDQRTNHTSSVQTGSFTFTARTGVVTSWETTVSSISKRSYGVNMTGSLPKIPIVVSGGVTLDSEAASSQIKADTVDESDETSDTQNYVVKPGETITGRFVATQASCDVPYSYKQRILLTTGEEIVTAHNDGIYTGVNKSDFHTTLTLDREVKAN